MILERLSERFPTFVLRTGSEQGEFFAVVKGDRAHEILHFLKEDPEARFEFLIDLCGVDRIKLEETLRFEVVYHLYSLTHNHRIRVRAQVSESDPRISSVTDLWKGADWFERECWEMFGIRFDGHPNLKHLLLFDSFEGHPLRKDYPIEKRQKIPMPEGRVR